MKRWKYLSLRKRLLISAAVIVLLGVMLWALAGYPALTAEGYLRRAERAHLLPEGDILLRIETKANGPDFLAAKNGAYIELCQLPKESTLATHEKKFYLYEKQGDLTAVVLPSSFYGVVLKPGYRQCALLLFDERPEVQRIELSFEIDGYTYTSQAEREVGGVFRCEYFHGEDLFYDHTIWGEYRPEIRNCAAKLYAADGSLIKETQVPVASPIA